MPTVYRAARTILKAGKLNSFLTTIRYLKRNNGYTLIELIVVTFLIGLMLFVAVPRLRDTVLSDNTKAVSRRIMVLVRHLKDRAVRDRLLYVLHVGIDTNKLWTTHEAMPEEELPDAAANGYELPDDVKVLDVDFPGNTKISTGQAEIFFYPQGYSDKALIHIANDDHRQFSFLIEPFLPVVGLYEEYVEFED